MTGRFGTLVRTVCLALPFIIAPPALTNAQAVRSGSISGTITDETGAALPGATVTLTSPALQVPQLVKISEARGDYQFVDLPAGSYRLEYELAGFAKLVQSEIRLTTGFASRVDVQLMLSSVAETVVVSGASPLVDLANTRGGTTVSKELIASTPNSLNYQDMYLLVGGVQVLGAPLTGESGLRPLQANMRPVTYGQGGIRGSHTLDGVMVEPNDSPDFTSFEEVDVKTFGNTAEVCCPGEATNLIVKSGGNDFHGRVRDTVQNDAFQSTNVDDELLAQGVSTGSGIKYYNDFSADLGGRVIRDKLWFYAAFHDRHNERTSPGFASAPGSDGVYGTLDDVAAGLPGTTQNSTVKVSYQLSLAHKLVGMFARSPGVDKASSGSRFVPLESTEILSQTNRAVKGEWQGAISPRLLVNVIGGQGGLIARREIQEMSLSTPNHFDRETSYQTGASWNDLIGTRAFYRNQLSGTLNYYPDRTLLGGHEISAGTILLWGSPHVNFPNQETGNYRLVFDRVAGVAHQPVEFWTHNYPVDGGSVQNNYAVFVSDTWRPTRRLTVNAGLRLDQSVVEVPPQNKVQGPYGTSGQFARVDVGTWTRLAPRVGAALDVVGDGKTVVKGSYGRYNHDWPYDFALTYNQNNVSVTQYRWRDLNRDAAYQPGEVNLDLNSLDFIATTGANTNVVNPDLRLPHTHEATGSIERELPGQMSVRGLFVYKRVVDNYTTAFNTLRPYSVYNQMLTRRDPGPDGVLSTPDDAGTITFYDYDPGYRGAAFVANTAMNATDRQDVFKNIELTLNRRPTGKWFAFTSLLATKNHRWLVPVVQSPNDNLYPLDETWSLAYRLAAGYEMPYGIHVSTLYQAYNGIPAQRSNLFRTIDPDGGPPIPSSGTLNLRVEPFGTRVGDARHIVNLRASKNVRLNAGRRLTFDVDAFNAFNSNVAWGSFTSPGINYASGPTFGYVTDIVPPRNIRFGVSLDF
jgi:Carboxypeptidase regulatory-like domain